MTDRGMNKVILVTRKTRLTELIYKYNTAEQAQFYMEHMGEDFSDYLAEDARYRQAVAQVRNTAQRYARVQEIDREYVPNMLFGKNDIVIAIGQDGLVANVMKYLNGHPLIGVNPDTGRWDGVLLPFEAGQMADLLPQVIAGTYHAREVTMAQADARDGQSMLAVNDLFIGCRTHASARYELRWNQNTENQSSSGIIISTGLGFTGWHKSVITQMNRMAELFRCGHIPSSPMKWEDRQLAFVVREPYPSRSTQAEIVYGRIGSRDRFHVVSRMPGNGVVFSDGMESDAMEFNSGSEIVIRISDKKGMLVV